MKESFVDVRLYNPEKDFEELKRNAAADNHSGVYCPTHVSVIRHEDGTEEIVGYLSVAAIPMVLCWQHSEKVGPLDSLRILGTLEGVLKNFKTFVVPCDPESPYNKLLPRAGYVKYTKPVTLYVKQ